MFLLACNICSAKKPYTDTDIITFRGVKIHGKPYAVKAQMRKINFRNSDTYNGVLEGKLLGQDVCAYIVENDYGEVYRIAFRYKYYFDSTTDVIKRYNSLLQSFWNNGNYEDRYNQLIDEDVDLSEDLSRYQSDFYQKKSTGETNWAASVWFKITKETSGKYNIWIYYDNTKLAPSAKDL